jgi:hypothetical protein
MVTLLTATAAVAQQTHSQYEPPNAPGAGQKLLRRICGRLGRRQDVFPDEREADRGRGKQYMIQDFVLTSGRR